MRLRDFAVTFVRVILCGFGVFWCGGFGFVLSGLLLFVSVYLASAVFNSHGLIEMIDRAYFTHPWGASAWLVTAWESLGLCAGAWFGLRVGMRLFRRVPGQMLEHARLALACFLALEAGVCAWELSLGLRLSLHHTVTTGHVLLFYPQEHGTVSYAYTVAGRSFERRGQPEDFSALGPGASVPVYYVPGEPGSSVLREPRRELLRVLMSSTLFLALFIGTPFAFAAARTYPLTTILRW